MRQLCLLALFFSFNISKAQVPEDAADYIKAIANAQVPMNSKYMEFMSAMAHNPKNPDMENLRRQVLENIDISLTKTNSLQPYKGDNSLRQSSMDYIQLCKIIFNDDFGRIVNTKEVEEQSYNNMQVSILLQEKASQKLIDASLDLTKTNLAFAQKYDVKLLDSRDKLTEKLAIAARLNHYRNQVFLVFYKCNWHCNEITKAVIAKKLNDVEQGRNALTQFATEGMKQLGVIGSFEGDATLIYYCNETLKFYKNLAETQIPQITNFLLAEENYNKIKKAYQNKRHTNEEKDEFKKEYDKFKAAITNYNQVNDLAIANRKMVLQNWSRAVGIFADKHMPHYK